MSIFDERVHFKPFEYPECEQFVKAINQSFWVVDEWNFIEDIAQFNNLDKPDQDIIRKSMLAISQVEVSVKAFWGDIFKTLPKPEVNLVGSTFAESEVRHSLAYSKLLEVLGLNEEFERIYDIPCIIGRVNYLKKYKNYLIQEDKKKVLKSLILFSLFVENVSLFSQFFVISSYNKHHNILKDMTAVVTATAKEECLHAEFGIYLVNKIKEEFPETWDYSCKQSIIKFAQKAYESECKVLDWIFAKTGRLKKGLVKDFLKARFNESLLKIGIDEIFEIKNKDEFMWYYEELNTTVHTDFFVTRPTTYSLKNKPITAGDLF